MAAVDYFLEVNGIKGGSVDAQHQDEIDVESFSWGVAQVGGAGAGAGGAAGKAQLGDLVISARTSIASPSLFLACATGQHIKDATLTGRHGGGSEFLRISLGDVVVTSYQIGGTGTEPPVDSISFGFARVEIEHRSMLPTGAVGPSAKAGWDAESGKKL